MGKKRADSPEDYKKWVSYFVTFVGAMATVFLISTLFDSFFGTGNLIYMGDIHKDVLRDTPSYKLGSTDPNDWVVKYLEELYDNFHDQKSDLRFVRDNMSHLEERFTRLEDAVGLDPDKAVSIISLKKDIINLETRFEHLYGLNKWIIGLMFPIALSVVALAASNFIPTRKTVKTTEDTEKKKAHYG
jgi:hypothetical protein